MKITRVETMVLNLPMLIEGATPMLGGRARTSIDMLLVRIDTDGGVTGWGEAFGHRIFPATRAAIDTLLSPMCVGRDPGQILALNDDLQRVLHGVGRNGPTLYALSGIDIALWDIAGKVAGQPLYRLLGGSARADLPAYASLLRYGTAEAVAHYTAQALGRGYRHIKLHEITVPEVKAARDVAGPGVPIMVDTNCPWTVAQAIEMARRLAPLDLHWLEEPVWPPENLAGLAEVRARGHSHRRRRELRHGLGVPAGLRGGGHHLRPAERDQDRRGDRAAPGHDHRRRVRRPRNDDDLSLLVGGRGCCVDLPGTKALGWYDSVNEERGSADRPRPCVSVDALSRSAAVAFDPLLKSRPS
jgi:hypothetical protein